MFKCAVTGKTSKPREGMIKVVTETRPKVYVNVNADGEEVKTKGTEIVKEIGVTQEGYEILMRKKMAEEVAAVTLPSGKVIVPTSMSESRRLEMQINAANQVKGSRPSH